MRDWMMQKAGIVLLLLIAGAAGGAAARASDPRREAPTPSPWMEIPSQVASNPVDAEVGYIYTPVKVYAQCDGATRVFVAVGGQYKYNAKATGVAIAAVAGGCERTKAENP